MAARYCRSCAPWGGTFRQLRLPLPRVGAPLSPWFDDLSFGFAARGPRERGTQHLVRKAEPVDHDRRRPFPGAGQVSDASLRKPVELGGRSTMPRPPCFCSSIRLAHVQLELRTNHCPAIGVAGELAARRLAVDGPGPLVTPHRDAPVPRGAGHDQRARKHRLW